MRPAIARRMIDVSLSRHYDCHEPLPAAGTAEVWIFEVRYRYQGEAFGNFSQPVNITVRG